MKVYLAIVRTFGPNAGSDRTRGKQILSNFQNKRHTDYVLLCLVQLYFSLIIVLTVK